MMPSGQRAMGAWGVLIQAASNVILGVTPAVLAAKYRSCVKIARLSVCFLCFSDLGGVVLALPGEASEAVEASTSAPRLLKLWESGLDVKWTTLFEEDTPLLSAQWFRRFATGTRLGLTLSALPTSVDRREADGSKTKMNVFYGGAILEQVLWEDAPYRISLSVSVGQGQLYLRNKLAGREAIFEESEFSFFEPAVHAYLYTFRHVDLGLMGSFRVARLTSDDVLEDSDVSGSALGMTFRHQI